MAKILQLAHLVEDNGMTYMNVRCGRIQAQLDTQWHPGCFATRKFPQPLGFNQQFVAAALGNFQGMHYGRCEGIGIRGAGGNFSHDVSL